VAVRVAQVNAIGPARVGFLGRVVETVNHSGKLDTQFAHASPGHKGALFVIFRAGEDNLLFYVALHLPDVAGMCFQNVDRQESHLIPVFLVKLVEGGNLPPERRSGVAAKYQNDRLLSSQGRELNLPALVLFHEGKVWGYIA